MGDLADARIVLPHLAGNLAVELGNAVCNACQPEGGQRVVELITLNAGDLADFLIRHVSEKREVAQQVEVVAFVACILRRVGREDEALFHLLQAVVLLVEMEGSGQAMRFIEVPDLGIHPELFEQACGSGAEHDVLGDPAEMIVIVKAVRDGTGKRVVFLHIRAEEKHRHRAENIARQEHRLHPYRVAMDRHGETDAGVLQERVFLLAELNRQLAVLTARLVVVAVGPEDADAAEVLLQIRRRAHVRSGQEAKAAGIDFETLVDAIFAGDVNGALGVLRIDFVMVGERFGKKRGSHGVGSWKIGKVLKTWSTDVA